MNNNATLGLLVGLLLAIAATTGGFGGFVLAVLLGGIGLALGLQRDGTIDLGALLRSRNRG
ncbi:hypothetical protein Gbro_3349 [Gordonia bronchialis DSM 43247]|uniref:DUF2273 domain-containing protein n=1 Tax=Gordonia bronchialis (strain ATCC 25592 / DSM 43247 / BCRC 13721 / JCM 3198 / KCTC 3076 / NBRC 16047 / NCTC 10667) TaxID=526226 RepID=D0LD60_GORB4|nr:hypothetical protein [Gordonia bronchialis]ACY22553.1 hypothetical protein Gbro_3349 [Gordonia bronchialis DSM 43247]MCC3325338.1 DUF2273 domain-containing protein [Gordonia bronchialis]QGS23955.1 DUF2273 domain-containing protein [Gordonia bronchialis]UAK39873.1 DUF2273 domain-containing protein [Gordonia bronchialis]STQ65482.1 Uncharacterised protein [Gordonia bronchialis]